MFIVNIFIIKGPWLDRSNQILKYWTAGPWSYQGLELILNTNVKILSPLTI